MGRGFRTPLAFAFSFLWRFPSNGLPSSAGSGGWNCFRQNSRGVSAEGLAGSGAARAKLTDLLEVRSKEALRHQEATALLHAGLGLLIGSPCTASISAVNQLRKHQHSSRS